MVLHGWDLFDQISMGWWWHLQSAGGGGRQVAPKNCSFLPVILVACHSLLPSDEVGILEVEKSDLLLMFKLAMSHCWYPILSLTAQSCCSWQMLRVQGCQASNRVTDSSSCCVAGGRTSDAIVDAALSALRSLVKDRLSGRSGGYSSGKQVFEGLCACFQLETVLSKR